MLETFFKPVDPHKRKAKVLYLMGATWHNRCMFDIDVEEDSLADILQKKNIEVITFNNYGTGPQDKTEIIGDKHRVNIEHAAELIEKHNIEYVFAYSYGCFAVRDLALRYNLKGIIILDPYLSKPNVECTLVDNGDKVQYTRVNILNNLKKYGTNILPAMLNAHLNALANGGTLVSATYPSLHLSENLELFSNPNTIKELQGRCKVNLILTKTPPITTEQLFPPEIVVRNKEASHWIMLEQHRYWLADQIEALVTI